jgi:hypothetical protein
LHFDGQDYEYADFSSITLGEALVLREYSGLNLDEVEDSGFHPGVIMALIHITVSRGNPDIPKKTLRAKIEKTPMAALEQVFADVAVEVPEEETRPPASTSETGSNPSDASETRSDGSEPTHGGSGGNGSARSDNTPPVTGSRGWGNGLASDPETSQPSHMTN